MHKVTVVGAVNIDICGKPENKFVPCDSNVGSVTHTIGGVGFNVARNLALLGADVSFIAAIGNDTYTKEIEKEAEKYSIDISKCLRVSNMPNSTYLFVTDENGDMLAAVNDMRITRKLGKEYFESVLPFINKSDAVVIDANLESEILEYICERVSVPIYADAVSACKAPRLKSCFGHLSMLKPNSIEAEILTGIDVKDFVSAQKAAEILVDEYSVKSVFITLGKTGALAYDGKTLVKRAALTEKLVNTAGAGDAFFACCVFALLSKKSLKECCDLALRGAACVCACETAVNVNLKTDISA